MYDYQDLVLKIFDILKPFNKDGKELNEDTDLLSDLGLDSMDVIKLLVMIEDSLDISIPLNILTDVHTVRDFAEQLQRLSAEGL